ncbi:hypothetical protein [Marinospirillum sp.]|nr:hypothetical protein [Marinospirillum sp.]
MSQLMQGKKILVIGIANDKSIAWECARKLHEQGAVNHGVCIHG